MNKQGRIGGIEWTRRKLPDGTVLPGFTWNVMGGCEHACEWVMPNGDVAECYAKTVAERLAHKSYPQGFSHHYFHPERLEEPLKLTQPAGIFLDSMSDLMGHWVPSEQIQQVLDVCRRAHWHTFFLLTKNPKRLKEFSPFPPNVWVGISSPPDHFMGKQLNQHQQETMLRVALNTLSEIEASVKWMSAEPLSWDIAPIVARYPDVLNWVVIGAASNGRDQYPPSETFLKHLLTVLDIQDVPVFYKGNLHSLPYADANWRDEFPDPMNPKRIDTSTSEGALELAIDWLSQQPSIQSLALEMEIIELRRQYADMCDRAARAEAALKPFAEAYRELDKHVGNPQDLALYAGVNSLNIYLLPRTGEDDGKFLEGANLKAAYDLLIAEGVIAKVVSE